MVSMLSDAWSSAKRPVMKRTSIQRVPHQMPPGFGPSGSARAEAARDEPAFDWAALVSRLVHPVKVTIIEAMLWIGQPLSASQLVKLMDDDRDYYLSNVSYHMEGLKKVGVVNSMGTRRVRGGRETFFFFPDG